MEELITTFPPAMYARFRDAFRSKMAQYPLAEVPAVFNNSGASAGVVLDTCYDLSSKVEGPIIHILSVSFIFSGGKSGKEEIVKLQPNQVLIVSDVLRNCESGSFYTSVPLKGVIVHGKFVGGHDGITMEMGSKGFMDSGQARFGDAIHDVPAGDVR
ncbi:OLC1v1014342C1 [Oldenlandia corymbosa var. corymbosa]|uniref:OLC1v1014342C1 n=1 Tax=Oldenlandia corymbosa var. corymbosa TaxID=529605 RepID=A0AAV1E194_OLDCO|nr:OLC1v1014342C1 [Oldenlandia corymbosa var. corymbosa]